jgi:ferredoxin-NADP reductase
LSHSMDSYGTVLLIAGGVGITHYLGYVRHLIQGFSDRVVATRHVTLIWVVKKPDEKHCVSRWIDEILRIEGRREVCQIEIWVTKGAIFASTSPSETVFVRRGRPDLAAIVRREADRQEGCMGVSVCAPGGLMDATRRAVRQEIKRGRNVEFVEEAFGW